jgi:DNA polymerase-1
LFEANPDDFEADPELAAGGASPVPGAPVKSTSLSVAKAKLAAPSVPGTGPARFAAEEHARVKAHSGRLRRLRDRHYARAPRRLGRGSVDVGLVAIDTETTGLDPQQADLVGVCLATKIGEACYIPVGHAQGGRPALRRRPRRRPIPHPRRARSAQTGASKTPRSSRSARTSNMTSPIFWRYGIGMSPIDDTMLISYALDGPRYNGLDVLAEHWLKHKCITFTELAGTGKAQKSFDQLDIAHGRALRRRGRRHHPQALARPQTAPRRRKRHALYETLERPARPSPRPHGSARRSQSIARFSRASRAISPSAPPPSKRKAYELAGQSFNLGSPKQLGDILFDKMGIEGGTKTKTGAWSTGADVLGRPGLQGRSARAHHCRLAPAHKAQGHLY